MNSFHRRFVSLRKTYHIEESESALNKANSSFLLTIQFLDDSEHTFPIEKKAKGSDLFQLVYKHIDLTEKDYFGLRYYDNTPSQSVRWLEPHKLVKKQLKDVESNRLYFGVKFYPLDPSKLQEELTRYLLFLQVKRDLREGRLLCPADTAALLVSYALQAEHGDADEATFPKGYLQAFSHQSEAWEELVVQLHRQLKGRSPAEVETLFLQKARQLDSYGVQLFAARISGDAGDMKLGVTAIGIVIFQNEQKMNTFPWLQILKVSFRRKQFFLQLRQQQEDERTDTMLTFTLPSSRCCKTLWQLCVEHHAFFRLRSSTTIAKPPFRLSSAYRYSGRTEAELQESIRREPSVRARTTASSRSSAPGRSGAHRATICTTTLGATAPSTASGDRRASAADDYRPLKRQASVVSVCLKTDNMGRFGFNVKGGSDQGCPVMVSRVAANSPAATSRPALTAGDQLLAINGVPTDKMSHQQIVDRIRAAQGSMLELTIRPAQDMLAESIALLDETSQTGTIAVQFEALQRKVLSLSCSEALKAENSDRNRYGDVLPYDATRVQLANGEYINANNVDLTVCGNVLRSIAAQGPLPQTTSTFWRMVFEQRSPVIVMLTAEEENGRPKCHRYWPALGQPLTTADGKLQVVCVSEDTSSAVYVARQLEMHELATGVRHPVLQVQYLDWPDHGVPRDTSGLSQLIQRLRKIRRANADRPVIAHCSAGIGRTGVLLLLEAAVQLIEGRQPVFPLELVEAMRRQRAAMVQTTTQFKFACDFILRVAAAVPPTPSSTNTLPPAAASSLSSASS